DSPLHLPNEEPVLVYLKFSAKGTKREVFGMSIPNKFITVDIQGEQYYKEYLEKVAKHQRYLTSEKGSDPDSPEPRVDDEEADIQRAVEESLKSFHDAPRGSLPPVVIKEPDSRKFQPLPEVQGKGKEKVSDEQVARDLLTLQKSKKVSHVEQYIFQRRTPASTKPLGHVESSSIFATLGLTDSASKSDKEVPPVVEVEAQDEGQAGQNFGVLTEGQAGPNPCVLTEGQAGLDPGVDAEPQPQSSHIVHAGPNLEHMDLEATDVSSQLYPEQMGEGFTATAY
nr:histone deacetylase 14 [Tanacetum cinerariifolium]